MISKILHYCWYGRKEKDALTERCIASWKKFCPDYQIMEWNENNCDIESSIWAKEAYENKKWAFVSDYFRLKVMYEYGGVYMDTDVELFKNIDRFLDDEAFLSYADDTYIASGMFGFSKKNEFCKKLLDFYDGRHFIREDGSFYDVANNEIYTAICIKELGFKIGDDHIDCGDVNVYPSIYFSPLKKRVIGDPEFIYQYSNFDTNTDTYAIHYTVYSWANGKRSKKETIMLSIKQMIRLILPRSLYFRIKRFLKIRRIIERVSI